MSMMRCDICRELCDTDCDPDSLYVIDDECICWNCRDIYDLKTEFELGQESASI